MSTFDPDTFLSTTYKETTDTKLIPVDEGEFMCQATKVAAKKITAKTGLDYYVLEVSWQVLDEDQKKKTGLEKPMARQSMFLELNESGNLDMSKGKNVDLGRLREALGQNSSTKPWAPSHIVGMTAYCKVKHDVDQENPEIIRNRVVAVSKHKTEDKKKAA